MNNEKFISLTKYLDSLVNRLEAPIPEKHKTHPEAYKQFLKGEISMVKVKLELAKLEGLTK